MNLFGENNTNIDCEELDATYDKAFKQLFCKKSFLAPILKNVIPEYKDLALERIEELISSDGNVPVQARVLDLEDVGGEEEAKIFYDVLIECCLPDGQLINADIYFDLEMQRDGSPGYDLIKRAIYYACRLISRQIPRLTEKETYDRLKPVYSVWIVKDRYLKRLKNCRYSISLKGECSHPKVNTSPLDEALKLMRIEFIYLSLDTEETEDTLIRYLQSIFNQEILDRDKNPYAEYAHNIQKEVKTYMTTADELREEGRKEGRREGRAEGKAETRIEMILNMYKNHLSLDQIAAIAGNTVDSIVAILKSQGIV